MLVSVVDTVKGVLDPRGPAVEVAADSFAPSDFSVHARNARKTRELGSLDNHSGAPAR